MTVATVANRCPERMATRSNQRCHRCHTLKGGNVATETQPRENCFIGEFAGRGEELIGEKLSRLFPMGKELLLLCRDARGRSIPSSSNQPTVMQVGKTGRSVINGSAMSSPGCPFTHATTTQNDQALTQRKVRGDVPAMAAKVLNGMIAGRGAGGMGNDPVRLDAGGGLGGVLPMPAPGCLNTRHREQGEIRVTHSSGCQTVVARQCSKPRGSFPARNHMRVGVARFASSASPSQANLLLNKGGHHAPQD